MKKAFSVAAIALSVFAAGCAIHPLPEDVTGVRTLVIVKQIRCETREAIRQDLIVWLKRLNTPLTAELARQYEEVPDTISGFHYNLFKGPEYAEVKAAAKLFYDAGIAYSFDLTMTEDNDFTTDISLLKPLTAPKFTLGVSGGAKRKRSNNRTFTLTDTFSYLLTKLNTEVRGEHYCDGHVVQANYAYPIAGRIGVDRLVNDFIELTLFANLAGAGAKPGSGGAPTMADKLTFTTALNASANPVVVFTPVTSAFQLTNASLTASTDRIDAHQVTVALAITPTGLSELDPLRSFLFSPDRNAAVARQTTGPRNLSPLYVGTRVTGGGTPAERLAVIAIDQVKSREIQIVPSP